MCSYQFGSLWRLSRLSTKNTSYMMELECLDQLGAHWDFLLDFQFLTHCVCFSISFWRSLNAPNSNSHTSRSWVIDYGKELCLHSFVYLMSLYIPSLNVFKMVLHLIYILCHTSPSWINDYGQKTNVCSLLWTKCSSNIIYCFQNWF